MSDKLSFQCPACDKVCKAPISMAGKAVNCPACKVLIEIPDPNERVESSTPVKSDLPQRRTTQSRAAKDFGPVDDPEPIEDYGPVDDEDDYDDYDDRSSRRENRRRRSSARSQGRRRSRARDDFDDYDDRPRRGRRGRGRRRSRSRMSGDSELNAIEIALCVMCAGPACCLGIAYLMQGKTAKGNKMILYSILAMAFWTIIRVGLAVATGQIR